MDPTDRRLVLGALRTSSNSLETVRDLINYLRRDRIFTEAEINEHMEEVIRIWREWKQQDALSPPDSNLGGKQDDADLDSPTGRLALYGPVDEKIEKELISLFRPQRANFGFANSRYSEGNVSFIQAKTVKNNGLEPEDDGTVVIQWKSSIASGGDPDEYVDETARNTRCIVLGPDDVKEVGMTVDIVFGTCCVADLDEQRSHIPPPRCPTPPEAPPSDINQPDASMASSSDEAEAQQMVPTQHPVPYPHMSSAPAQMAPYIQATNVFILNSPDQMPWAAQLGSTMENRGVAGTAGPSAASMSGTQATSGSKRQADGNAQGFGRAKKFRS
ncbi:hypothetical protein N8I77_006544 [Diaporthe amygdali]|uniref:Uncharacterized protein n=1 Tax=Phomopsis amygdali TaxID=1214568 RepID=A0AAD9SJE9_PHOAM|nr:hypothetical protein N8I77_006544 [Diaporthe amygdali]